MKVRVILIMIIITVNSVNESEISEIKMTVTAEITLTQRFL